MKSGFPKITVGASINKNSDIFRICDVSSVEVITVENKPLAPGVLTYPVVPRPIILDVKSACDTPPPPPAVLI